MKEFYTLGNLRDWEESRRDISPPIRLAVVGHSVAHSLSPRMQNAALADAGSTSVTPPFEFRLTTRGALELVAGSTSSALIHRAAQDRGALLRRRRRERARETGAINTIVFRDGRSLGWNTDGPELNGPLKSNFPLIYAICASSCLERLGERVVLAYQCALGDCERPCS